MAEKKEGRPKGKWKDEDTTSIDPLGTHLSLLHISEEAASWDHTPNEYLDAATDSADVMNTEWNSHSIMQTTEIGALAATVTNTVDSTDKNGSKTDEGWSLTSSDRLTAEMLVSKQIGSDESTDKVAQAVEKKEYDSLLETPDLDSEKVTVDTEIGSLELTLENQKRRHVAKSSENDEKAKDSSMSLEVEKQMAANHWYQTEELRDDDTESTTMDGWHNRTQKAALMMARKVGEKSMILDKTDWTAINWTSGTLTPTVATPAAHHTLAIIAGIPAIDRINDMSAAVTQERVENGSTVTGVSDPATSSTADGTTGGSGVASGPALQTVTSPSPSLTSEDRGHTAWTVPATDWAPWYPGSLGKSPTFPSTLLGRGAFGTTVLKMTEQDNDWWSMTTMVMPTFRGVKSFATVTTGGAAISHTAIGSHEVGGRTVLSTHPTGTVVASALVTTPKKMKFPLGKLVFPATESFQHYTLGARIASTYAREWSRSPTKKVGMTSPAVRAATRPSSIPGPAVGLPGTAEDSLDSSTVVTGGPTVLTPVLSGPGLRQLAVVLSLGPIVKEVTALMTGTSVYALEEVVEDEATAVVVALGRPLSVSVVPSPSTPNSSDLLRSVVTLMTVNETQNWGRPRPVSAHQNAPVHAARSRPHQTGMSTMIGAPIARSAAGSASSVPTSPTPPRFDFHKDQKAHVK